MRPRRLLAAVAGPAVLAVLIVVAGPALGRAGTTASPARGTHDAAVAMVDGIPQAALNAPALSQRSSADGALAAYVVAAATVALVFAFWTAGGLSSWSL